MNFFTNLYELVAKKLGKIFVLIGFIAYGAMITFEFIGSSSLNPTDTFGYLVGLAFDAVILAGLIVGYYFKKEKLLAVSFIAFLTLTFYTGIVSSLNGAFSALEGSPWFMITYWVFLFLFNLAVASFIVFLVLVYLFNINKVIKAMKIAFLTIFPLGLLYWIFGIIFAAETGVWYMGVVPLFECASFLFVPAVLLLGDKKGVVDERVPEKEEEPAPIEEAVDPEVEEEK